MVERADVRVHPTAEVSPDAVIGPGTSIWNQAQVREDARIGAGCIIGKNVYVDAGVVVGDRVKIQNNVSLFRGVTVEDGVFVGPHVCFTNDRVPRAINRDGSPKTDDDWEVTPILVRSGAALGANSTILPGVTIGRWAMVGAGSVVTRDVADNELVAGNPARRLGSACACGAAAARRRRRAVRRRLSGMRDAVPVVRIATVVGARPQFVKAAPVSRALAAAGHDETMIHTGQHYDDAMSAAFFRDLEMDEPALNLEVGGGSHGTMTGEMMRRLEPALSRASTRRRHRLRRYELDPGRGGRGRKAVLRRWPAALAGARRSGPALLQPAHARGAQPDRGRPPGGPVARPDAGGDGQPRPRGARRARGAGRRRDGRRTRLGQLAGRLAPARAGAGARAVRPAHPPPGRERRRPCPARQDPRGTRRSAAGRLSGASPDPHGPRARRPRASTERRRPSSRSATSRWWPSKRPRWRSRPIPGASRRRRTCPACRASRCAARRSGSRRSRPAGIASSTPIRPRSPMRWPTRPSCGATALVRRSSATERPLGVSLPHSSDTTTARGPRPTFRGGDHE